MATIIIPTKQHTSTLTAQMLVEWNCSACGALNRQNQPLVGRGTSTGGAIETKKGAAKKAAQAQKQAEKDLTKKALKIASQAEQKKYAIADMHCACSNCQNRESWANYKGAPGWAAVVAFVGIPLLILGGIIGITPVAALGMILIVVGLILSGILGSVSKSKNNKLIAQMPEQFLPTITMRDWSLPTGQDGLLICRPGQPAQKTQYPQQY